ncbi:ComEA family DNA-binding protein [Streptomyces sp. BE147]|nr:ComEA family DNA-binding protein [Streptomyces sp. BE147]
MLISAYDGARGRPAEAGPVTEASVRPGPETGPRTRTGTRPLRGSAPPDRPGAAPPLAPSAGRGTRLSRRMGAVLALRDRLPLWLRLRCGLEPKTFAALAVVLVGAAVLATMHFWTVRPQPVRAPELMKGGEAVSADVREPSSSDAAAPPMGTGPGQPAAAEAGGRIVVDVSGKVRWPGVRSLPVGSRVTDALKAAGGVREGTDVTGINRARVLMDGEQVVVGPVAVQPGSGTPGGGGGTPAGPPGATVPVSLNTASAEQLETLPGVGPVLAQHIVDYRTEHGGYRSVGELRQVRGIGDRRFADLEPLVRP